MYIKRLPYYITKFTDVQTCGDVFNRTSEEQLRNLPYDEAIPLIHRTLQLLCPVNTVRNIIEHFMKHEVKRERLEQSQMDFLMRVLGYECRGCIENQPNQMAHMHPGGCLCPDDEWW